MSGREKSKREVELEKMVIKLTATLDELIITVERGMSQAQRNTTVMIPLAKGVVRDANILLTD